MATWQQVSTILTNGKVHPGEMVNDSLLKVQIPTKDGRSQVVMVLHAGDNIVFSSAVCKIDDVNLVALFKEDILNKVVYGLSSVGDYLVMRHVSPLENLDLNELAQPIVQLAFFGDVLEEIITGKDYY
jgi:uncharacterized protein YjfI (DUF2170 family)